jgi:hypothetical protein
MFKRTEGELLNVSFSVDHSDQLLSVEEVVSPLQGEVKALVCTYEFGRNRVTNSSIYFATRYDVTLMS